MYVVAREFRADGRIYQPGDPCPEAANWPTLRALLSGGWIKRAPPGQMGQPGPPRSPQLETGESASPDGPPETGADPPALLLVPSAAETAPTDGMTAERSPDATPAEAEPFACDVCGRGFKSAQALRAHQRVHRDGE